MDYLKEDFLHKKILFCKILHFLGMIIFAIYILKINFSYQISSYNFFLLPAWFTYAFLPLLVYQLFKSCFFAEIIIGFTGSILIIFLIYICGGAVAPGLFWLTSIPWILGLLFGLTGTFIGIVTTTAAFLIFQYLKLQNLNPNIIPDHIQYENEMFFSSALFIIISGFTTYQFIKSENNWTKKITQKNADIDNLLRMLLHDVGNALFITNHNILNAKKAIELGQNNGELEKIERSIESISGILNQVRNIKSAKDGKIDIKMNRFNITPLIEQVCKNCTLLAAQKNLKINFQPHPEELYIKGEKNLLSLVILTNIIHNAIKFSEPGGRIFVRGRLDNKKVLVEIQDEGIGIPKSLLPHVFDLHRPTTRKGTQGEKGTGYGLPLVKEYLKMMNGTIEIESEDAESPDKTRGTKVILTFPQAFGDLIKPF